jgi:lysophospholipase
LEVHVELVENESYLPLNDGKLYLRSIASASAAVARLAVVHGYGDHSGRFVQFMRFMAGHGVACHAADLRGQGKSSGRRGYVARWDHYLDDLDQFLAALGSHEKLPLFLLGHSHGGLVVASAVIRGRPGVRSLAGCVLTSPFFKARFHIPPWKILAARFVRPMVPWMPFASNIPHHWLSSDPQMIAETAQDGLCVRAATPSWYVGHLAAQRRVMEQAGQFKLPLLLLAAGADPIADPAEEKRFFDACGSSDKQFKLYENCRHELLREVCRQAVFEEVLRWIHARI